MSYSLYGVGSCRGDWEGRFDRRRNRGRTDFQSRTAPLPFGWHRADRVVLREDAVRNGRVQPWHPTPRAGLRGVRDSRQYHLRWHRSMCRIPRYLRILQKYLAAGASKPRLLRKCLGDALDRFPFNTQFHGAFISLERRTPLDSRVAIGFDEQLRRFVVLRSILRILLVSETLD